MGMPDRACTAVFPVRQQEGDVLSKSLEISGGKGRKEFYPGEEKKTKYNSQAFLKSKTHNTDGEMESMRK